MKSIVSASRCWIVAALLFLPCRPAEALLVAPPATNDNTSAPADDPGWLNVGTTGIYLGNLWVLTAAHVGPQTITFPGVPGSFNPVPLSDHPVPNPSLPGLTSFADLVLFQLDGDPGLPQLSLTTTTPAIGARVTFIGDGAAVTTSATETHWNVTGTEPDLVWNEVGSGGNASGYRATTSRKLWGTNLVEDDSPFFMNQGDADHTVNITTAGLTSISFLTEFDDGVSNGPATDHEAQGMSGDSGSAVFEKIGDHWVLSGVTLAVGIFDNQPGEALTAVYGNITLAADLSWYSAYINSVTGIPEVNSFWLVAAAAAVAGIARLGVRPVRRLAP